MNKLNIALVSDYFFPNKGGVETHIRTIGEELFKLGHSVIVITHKYKDYEGCLRIGNLIVYYLDIPLIANNTTIPTIYTNYVIFKELFDRHSVQVVHGHQSLSNLCMESLYHASSLSIKTVLTDHSIFEIAKPERALVNRLSSFICRNVDLAICVSKISKENTHLRTKIPLGRIVVIPNGIDPGRFYPKEKKYTLGNQIRIIVMSRLSFRKGVDLLADALPLICMNKSLRVIIIGDGPKRGDIEQKIDDCNLWEQVSIMGEVGYESVGDILRTGDIFLSTSLTETFCLAILEAASCGLAIVSTNVGGIHEVLSGEDIYFCRPTPEDIAEQVFNAVRKLERHDPSKVFNAVCSEYNWQEITKRVEKAYMSIPLKRIGFETVIRQLSENRQFLGRLGTCLEYLQIKLFDMLK